jgi:hypothetical protein
MKKYAEKTTAEHEPKAHQPKTEPETGDGDGLKRLQRDYARKGAHYGPVQPPSKYDEKVKERSQGEDVTRKRQQGRPKMPCEAMVWVIPTRDRSI